MSNAMVLAAFLLIMLVLLLGFAVYMTRTGDKMRMLQDLQKLQEKQLHHEDKMDAIESVLKNSIEDHISSNGIKDSTTPTWEQPPEEIHNPRHKR